MNLNHAKQLQKLVDVIVKNQKFINNNSPNLKIEKETPLRPVSLKENIVENDFV